MLAIGEARINCFVLDDGTRVLSQRGISEAFGVTPGGMIGGQRRLNLPRFLSPLALLAPTYDAGSKFAPTAFRSKSGGVVTGVSANLLPAVCEAWLTARDARLLRTERQLESARRAEAIMRGLASIGIITLVDEATNNQQLTCHVY